MAEPGQKPRPSVVTPGNHDGVHVGHRALVARARAWADDVGADAAALVFDPHPTTVLRPEAAPALLTRIPRRAALLREAGADRVEVQRFDAAFAGLSPEAFVDRVLVGKLACVGVVVGPDFRFGRKRAGDVEALAAMGRTRGFDVAVVAPVEVDGERASSSRVRALLGEGDVAGAARLLTRHHEVAGEVVRGDGRGAGLGFPTANLAVEETLLPADGVYSVRVRRCGADGPLLDGVANLGTRPTFGAGRSVEVHLLDADLDLYGAELRVGFVARVRGERRFDGVDALVARIREDVATARGHLAEASEALARCL